MSGDEIIPEIYRVSLFLFDMNVVKMDTFSFIVVAELYALIQFTELSEGDVHKNTALVFSA